MQVTQRNRNIILNRYRATAFYTGVENNYHMTIGPVQKN